MREEPPESEDPREPPFSPGAAEERLRRGRLAAAAETRARLESAALELAGEDGYGALTVQRILMRTGTSRPAFYAIFADKEECFVRAYDGAATELEGALLAHCEESADWTQGLLGALRTLGAVLETRPAWARGVLAEAQVAGGAAGARRREAVERLSRAMDRARREIASSRHSPPPVTAAFILAAIESAAVRNLRERGGHDFGETVPELLYLGVAPYLGEKAAAAAYREARRR
jgi:AcrR family transcriptional regulator